MESIRQIEAEPAAAEGAGEGGKVIWLYLQPTTDWHKAARFQPKILNATADTLRTERTVLTFPLPSLPAPLNFAWGNQHSGFNWDIFLPLPPPNL